jgi:hypothetical protein
MFRALLGGCLMLATGAIAHSAEMRITGLYGIAIGDDAWNYAHIGRQQIIDTGRLAPEWVQRIDPAFPSPDLFGYYVHFNPRDRSIYEIVGASGRMDPQDCLAALNRTFGRFHSQLPQHPFDYEEGGTFIIAGYLPGESDIIGECVSNELRISVINNLRFRRHQIENQNYGR